MIKNQINKWLLIVLLLNTGATFGVDTPPTSTDTAKKDLPTKETTSSGVNQATEDLQDDLDTSSQPLKNKPAPKLIDYAGYTHSISVKEFRSGNFAEGVGEGQYYITIKISSYGLEKKAPLETETLGKFAEMSKPNLTHTIFKGKDEGPGLKFTIEGEKVRLLVSKTMALHGLSEQSVSVQCKVELFGIKKKYYVLNTEIKILEDSYFILDKFPLAKGEERGELDFPLQLTISDGESTLLVLTAQEVQNKNK